MIAGVGFAVAAPIGFTAFTALDPYEFVDYAERFRNLPFVGTLRREVYERSGAG